jgi:hypothetical protein
MVVLNDDDTNVDGRSVWLRSFAFKRRSRAFSARSAEFVACPINVGVAAAVTTMMPIAYRSPAVFRYDDDHDLVYAVDDAANKVVSFAVDATNVPDPSAAIEYNPMRHNVGVAPAAVVPE